MRGPAASQLPGSTGSGGWRSVGRSLQLCPSPPTPTVPSLFFRAQFSEMEKGQLGLSGSERADGAVGTLGERRDCRGEGRPPGLGSTTTTKEGRARSSGANPVLPTAQGPWRTTSLLWASVFPDSADDQDPFSSATLSLSLIHSLIRPFDKQ